MRLIHYVRGSLVPTLLLLAAPMSFGQAVYGSIFGTVLDSSGAAVPGATVTVTDVAKGTLSTLTSNGSGEFTADHLIPDHYNVKVTFAGFKTFEASDLPVFADTSQKVQAVMQLGGSNEIVEVNATDVPQLKVDRADVSTNFDAKQLEDLPIGDRNFTNLQLLLPGAQQLGWSHAASENPQGSKQIQVDGQAFGGVAYELDGTDNQDPILGIIVINPNIDSLQESKITTQNFDAEFGKAVSSVVTAQTKSGSNSFHGSLFDYRQSSANLARDPFSQGPRQLTPTSPFPKAVKNQFGGSLGGPIIKDKLFFFGDYQGLRQTVGSSLTQTVPSALLTATCLGTQIGPSGIAGCDFSEYLAALPAVNDPNTKQSVASGTIFQPSVDGAAPQPYPGNVIPTSQLSPAALNLITQLAAFKPNNNNGQYSGLVSNYSASGQGSLNSNQYDVRLDYQANARLHAFTRVSRFTDTLTGKTIFGPAGGGGFGLGGFGGNSKGHNTSVAIGSDFVFSPTLVLDTRIGYYRYNINNQKYNAGVDYATQLGIPGENLGTPITSGAPNLNITEFGGSGGPNNGSAQGPQYGGGLNVNRCNCPLKENEDQFQLVNNLTKTIGNHAIKFGADLRFARNLRVPSDNDRTGINQFGTGPTSNGSVAGLGFASFVKGNVTNFQRFVSSSTDAKEFQKRDFFYVQDTWRATRKLTINYGLRYEFYFPETINTKGQGALLNLNTGYLQVAGVGGVSSNMNYGRSPYSFNPRLGVAYQINNKTVVRAGYGRSFDLGVFGSLFGHVATQNLPVLANQQITQPGGPQTIAFLLDNGPVAPVLPATPANGLLPNPGYAVQSKSRPTTLLLPTIDAWNLSVERQVTSTLTLTVAYVGNKGTHTLSAGDGNTTNPNEAAIFLPAQYSVTGNALHYDPSVAGTDVSGIAAGSAAAGAGITGIAADGGTNNQNYLKRYYGGKLVACSDPNYAAPAGVPAGSCGWKNDVSYYGDNQNTHYNALQVGVAKIFTHGLSFNANYAWQRAYNFANGYATWIKRAGYGRDDSIREQQITIYGIYDLPFGKNRQFLSNGNRLVQELVGGFQISPIITYATGLPFTLSYSGSGAQIPGSVPTYVNGNAKALKTGVRGVPGVGTGVSFYSPQTLGGAFTIPGLDQIGNTGRNSVYGPHFFNADLAIQKDFPITERFVAQLRMDAYNAFNHINLGNPGGNIQNNGSITNGAGVNGSTNPRQLQFSGRLQF
jgi:hypothetical protein